MTKKARQAYQYEPPVTPAGWKGDEMRFSIRVKAILEDLYQKFSAVSARANAGGTVQTVNGQGPDSYGDVAVRQVFSDSGNGAVYFNVQDSEIGIHENLHGYHAYLYKENGVIVVYNPSGQAINTLYGTAYKPTAYDLGLYPVGSIFMSAEPISPASLFGGTWEQLKDRFLLGTGDKYWAGNTGGEAEHILTIDEMPNHNHTFYRAAMYYGEETGEKNALGETSSTTTSIQDSTGYTGRGWGHNNMPPYLVVYMWKRVS